MADSMTPSTSAIPPTELEQQEADIVKENFMKMEFIPFCLIIVIGFIGNLVVIYNGRKKKVLSKHYSNYFILSIAVADLGVVMMAIPINIVEYTNGLNISQSTCAFIIPIRETFQSAAMQSVAILGLARFRHITRPPHVPLSKRSCLFVIAVIWLSSYLVVSLPLAFVYKISPKGVCDPEWPTRLLQKIHVTLMMITLYLPMLIATISYVAILRQIKNLSRPGNDGESAARRNRNLSILLVLLITTFWISALPLGVYMLLLVNEQLADVPVLCWSIIGILYYTSSAVNPLLVIIMKRDHRLQLPRCVRRKGRVGNIRSHHEMEIQNQNVGNCALHGDSEDKNKEEKKAEREEESG